MKHATAVNAIIMKGIDELSWRKVSPKTGEEYLNFQSIAPLPVPHNSGIQTTDDDINDYLIGDLIIASIARAFKDKIDDIPEYGDVLSVKMSDLEIERILQKFNLSDNEAIVQGSSLIYHANLDGYISWFKHRKDAWGCLSNGLKPKRLDDRIMMFLTKDGFATKIAKEISEKFPDREVTIVYSNPRLNELASSLREHRYDVFSEDFFLEHRNHMYPWGMCLARTCSDGVISEVRTDIEYIEEVMGEGAFGVFKKAATAHYDLNE